MAETFIKRERKDEGGVKLASYSYRDDFAELHLAIESTYKSGVLQKTLYNAREYEYSGDTYKRSIALEIDVIFDRGEVVKFKVKDTRRSGDFVSVVSQSLPVVNDKIDRPAELANKYKRYGKEQFFVIACDEVSEAAALLDRRGRNLPETSERLERIVCDAQYMKGPIRVNIVRELKKERTLSSELRAK